ncbi:hypothetical protein JKP88DRAFT_279824 [Tribonema minus]|uniref:Uncharacterized protein n=1 Tax=Tribonema minus TaxID=303371 RepID=A0A835YV68_9STRA|nr:hypothetical protein JKP88DRAFT_279824 [Tribonema minus]
MLSQILKSSDSPNGTVLYVIRSADGGVLFVRSSGVRSYALRELMRGTGSSDDPKRGADVAFHDTLAVVMNLAAGWGMVVSDDSEVTKIDSEYDIIMFESEPRGGGVDNDGRRSSGTPPPGLGNDSPADSLSLSPLQLSLSPILQLTGGACGDDKREAEGGKSMSGRGEFHLYAQDGDCRRVRNARAFTYQDLPAHVTRIYPQLPAFKLVEHGGHMIVADDRDLHDLQSQRSEGPWELDVKPAPWAGG